jgi:hypothetical protein
MRYAPSGIIHEIGPYFGHYDFDWLLAYKYNFYSHKQSRSVLVSNGNWIILFKLRSTVRSRKLATVAVWSGLLQLVLSLINYSNNANKYDEYCENCRENGMT